MSQRLSLSLFAFLMTAALAAPAIAQEHPKEPAKPAAKAETKAEKHPAARQAAGAAKGEAKGDPQITSTAYGNWSLRCQKEAPPAKDAKAATGEKPARACEISETLEASDHSGPIAKLSIGRPGGKGSLFAVLIVPNNISFPSSVHIRTDDKDIWGLRLDWVRCIPGGCFAQAQLADATVGYWHGLDSQGEIRFPDSTGADVSLPISFHGFGQALDALNKAF
jgi:invasion protein IalB